MLDVVRIAVTSTLVLAAIAGAARADVPLDHLSAPPSGGAARPGEAGPFEARWPAVHPHDTSMADELEDWATSVGVDVDRHLSTLSHEVLELRIDGRGHGGHLGVHATTRYLAFALEEDVHYADGCARMRTHLQLELGEHALDVQLPDVEMKQDDYHGERIVELHVPLLVKHW